MSNVISPSIDDLKATYKDVSFDVSKSTGLVQLN